MNVFIIWQRGSLSVPAAAYGDGKGRKKEYRRKEK